MPEDGPRVDGPKNRAAKKDEKTHFAARSKKGGRSRPFA
jgi:hypothetical protein